MSWSLVAVGMFSFLSGQSTKSSKQCRCGCVSCNAKKVVEVGVCSFGVDLVTAGLCYGGHSCLPWWLIANSFATSVVTNNVRTSWEAYSRPWADVKYFSYGVAALQLKQVKWCVSGHVCCVCVCVCVCVFMWMVYTVQNDHLLLFLCFCWHLLYNSVLPSTDHFCKISSLSRLCCMDTPDLCCDEHTYTLHKVVQWSWSLLTTNTCTTMWLIVLGEGGAASCLGVLIVSPFCWLCWSLL